jgi:hypothetical protein
MNKPSPVNPPELRSTFIAASSMPWQRTEFDGIPKPQSAALNALNGGLRSADPPYILNCDTITTLERNCAGETARDRFRPRFRPDSGTPLPRVGFRLGLGHERGIATCLPLAAPVLRASTSELAVLDLKRRWFRPRVQGNSSGCWRSRSQPHRWRPARSPRSSPKNPNFALSGRRRWATIKRHRP